MSAKQATKGKAAAAKPTKPVKAAGSVAKGKPAAASAPAKKAAPKPAPKTGARPGAAPAAKPPAKSKAASNVPSRAAQATPKAPAPKPAKKVAAKASATAPAAAPAAARARGAAAPSRKGRRFSKKELAHFRELLLRKQRELLQAYSIAKGESRARQPDGTEDYIDYAVSSYDREFLLSLTELDQKHLMLVDEALRQIERGGFGLCNQCEQEIPVPRLEVQPWARYCVRCQELDEQGLLVAEPGEDEEDDYLDVDDTEIEEEIDVKERLVLEEPDDDDDDLLDDDD